MTNHTITRLLRRKWILFTVAVPVLVALWWAFRPEKLWINQKVNEAAPFDASSDPQPILTGRFEGDAHPTSGRATVYKKPGGGQFLRLNDFTTQNGPDVHLVLARSDHPDRAKDVVKDDPASIDFGPLQSNHGDQNYDLPIATDLNKYKAVVIYCEQVHAVCAWAKLEPF